mgnify:CR=1 FL=1
MRKDTPATALLLDSQNPMLEIQPGRRVAARCALHPPDLVKGVLPEALEKRLRQLAKRFADHPIEMIECETLPPDDWHPCVTLRPAGPSEGRGTVSRGAIEMGRYLHDTGAGG